MPSLPFTLRQLEVFSHLANTASFRRTAEMLGISQASVSNQMKVLEEQLGRRLLNRKPGMRPTLTPDGLAFRDDLHIFERAAETLSNHRRRGEEAQDPVRFRLLVGQGMFDAYVRPKLDQFLTEHPMIELDFKTQPPSDGLDRSLNSGQFDFGLINSRCDRPTNALLENLARVRGGVYGHRDFAAGHSIPMQAEDVTALPFVLPQAGSRQEREAMRSLAEFGVFPRKTVGHSQYYDVMAAMLERGIAVASFSEAILPVKSRENVIQLIPLTDWHLEFYRKDDLTGAPADAVEAFLKSSLLNDPDYPATQIFVQNYGYNCDPN